VLNRNQKSKRPVPKWLKAVLLAAAVLALIALGALLFRPRPVPVVAERVVERTVRSYVDERAMTSVPQRHVVSMPYDGRIARIDLEEGDIVHADQVVARLVPRDIELNLATAQAAMDRITASIAENAYIALELNARRQAELMAEAMQKMAEASQVQITAIRPLADYWRQAAARARELVQRSAQSIDELQLAEANEAARRAEVSQQELSAQAQQLLSSATRLVPQLINDYLGRKRLQGDVLRQQLEEARIALEAEQLRAERAMIKSPVDGVVLKRHTYSEQFLRAGDPLLEIGELDRLEIEAEVLSQEAAHIRVGDPVEVYGPAINRPLGNGLAARVKRIHPDAFTKISSLGVEQQRVLVDVELPPETLEHFRRLGVGVGYRIRVRIYTDTRENVLAVPRSALFRNDDGGWSVMAIRQGRAVELPVETGIVNDEWAEIVSGLPSNELIIVAPDSELDPGAKVVDEKDGRKG